jgi:hypothetical protein
MVTKILIQKSSKAVCCIFLLLSFISSHAQEHKRLLGFEVNFGTKSTELTSEYDAIDGMNVVVEGGTVGLVIGNQIVKSRLQVSGFYYSSAKVKHTVNVFASGLIFNFYPLNLINKSERALNPYLSSGITYNILKFNGYYTTEDSKINYSRSSAPYIGKIAIPATSAGAGLEWRLPRMYDFIHLFAEARYSWIFGRKADQVFRNTKIDNPTSINVGVSFGFLR